ncbi:MAG TPA: AAA family ATPase, partial [Bacteroidota bacterium]|nr:AAA family ATPase [Bacteroidota bacterium]
GLVETREGLSEGVRFLSKDDSWKPSRILAVADAVHAQERHRAAIEAALGEFTGLLVVETAAEAERGMALLKSSGQGKATFVCLDRVPRISSHRRLPKISGVLGWAYDLAQCEGAHRALFRLILDRTIVVETADAAVEASRRIPGIRCVTLDGEVRSGIGLARGGSRRQDEGSLIGTREQIDELHGEISSLKEKLRSAEDERAARLADHDAIDLKSFADAVKSVEKEMNGIEMRIAQVVFEKKRAADIIAKNLEEMETLRRESASLESEIAGDAPALAALAERKAEVERAIGSRSQELETLEQEWNMRSGAVNELTIALVTLRGDLQKALDGLARAEESAREATLSIQERKGESERGRTEIASSEASVEQSKAALRELADVMSVIEERQRSVEGESSAVRDQMHAIELAIRDRRRTHDDTLRSSHEQELKLADLRARGEHIRARAKEEFEFDLTLKSYPDDEFVDFAAVREEIQRLRDRSKSLGNINFAAFEEFTQEKQRLEFLTGQRKDLLEAEKTLLATIEEINATAQKKFLDTFALIRANFIETFKSLFDPGDECDLKLEEGVDPLEARIEIVAKPRGKRPTSIDLLSGGEKTLTATALLFAIYLVKPSPFCILDEVDAPLDDANVDRFTRILRKFSDNTQFIVVTHNKRTMEAAAALYGVTMEEEGISKLVTVRFTNDARVESAALASA